MQQGENQYRPGQSNIGQREVMVRKKFFYFFLVITIGLSFTSFFYCDSLLCWSFMLVSSFTLTVLYLQIRYRFCVLFGFFNLFNFGSLGNLNEVTNKEHSKKDRRRAFQITMEAIIVSMIYSSLIHILATKYHF